MSGYYTQWMWLVIEGESKFFWQRNARDIGCKFLKKLARHAANIDY
jgi:hypothetical protein